MDADLRHKEREAWAEVVRRLDFFAHAFRELDITAYQLAAQKLGKAVKSHSPLYVARMESEFGLDVFEGLEES